MGFLQIKMAGVIGVTCLGSIIVFLRFSVSVIVKSAFFLSKLGHYFIGISLSLRISISLNETRGLGTHRRPHFPYILCIYYYNVLGFQSNVW